MQNKQEVKKQVIEYVRKEFDNKKFPTYKELQKLFRIHHYGIKLDDIYFELGFDILNFPVKRPNNSYGLLKEKIIEYVRQETSQKHYPSRRHIESKFKVRLSKLFDGIDDLYSKAGLKYIKKPSQKIKAVKSRFLLKIVMKDVLPRLNLRLIKYCKVHQHGADILTKDIENRIIVVELKAYNKFEPIKKKDIEQVSRFLIKNKSERAIVITTTQKIQGSVKIPNNIRIILFEELKKLVSAECEEKLNFIRSYSVHRETNEVEAKKKKIILYVKKKYSEGKDFSYKDILKDLHIDMRTCFNSIYEIYKEAGIPFPIRKMKNLRSKIYEQALSDLKGKIMQYVKEQVENGRYPSGIEVSKKFGISHVWNIVTMSEIYHQTGLPTYHERKHRKPVILNL